VEVTVSIVDPSGMSKRIDLF